MRVFKVEYYMIHRLLCTTNVYYWLIFEWITLITLISNVSSGNL
jgi:hypothetical protein